MRLVLSLLLFTFEYQISDADKAGVKSIKDLVDQKLEELRTAIPEPITVTNYTLDLPDNDYLTGHLDVRDLKLSGIKEFNATLKYVLIPKSFNLSFEYIELNSSFVSDLQLLNQELLTIFGEGRVSIALSNLTFTGKINISSIPLNLINSMEISLLDAKFLFNGLLNDDEFTDIINNYLNSNFINLFNQYSNVLATKLEDAINDVIADILNGNSTVGLKYEDLDEAYGTEGIEEVFQEVVIWIISLVE